MRHWVGMIAAVAITFGVGTASAASCKVGGAKFKCDFLCKGKPVCDPELYGGPTDVNGDGVFVICGTSGDDLIIGTPGDDVICGGAGNDHIYGSPAQADVHLTYSFLSMALDGGGSDRIDSGPGDDLIVTGSGDDELFGGKGDDLINAGSGVNALHGGRGDDVLLNGSAADVGEDGAGELGGTVCGGRGNDTVRIVGLGFQCVDAGADQWAVEQFPDCVFDYPVFDGMSVQATARGCASPSGFLDRSPPCGCTD